MDSTANLSEAFSATTPFYFCSTCGKVYYEENSHARHVQYCRRRAARPPRPKACLSCKRSKSKCDFRSPCTRCTRRQIVCAYQEVTSASSSSLYEYAIVNDLQAHAGAERCGEVITGSATIDPHTSLRACDLSLTVNSGELIDVPPFHDKTTSFPISSDSLEMSLDSGDLFAAHLFMSLAVVVEPQINNAALYSDTFTSSSLRQHIMYILRSYPRMLTRPDKLPPFIHAWGCGRHFDHRDMFRGDDQASMKFAPLHPLATCISIAHMFKSRTTNSEEFIWRTIEGEQARMVEQMHHYSPGETLAAVQAMAMYIIMRLITSGPDYFHSNREMPNVIRDLFSHFTSICPGPTVPPHDQAHRPTWEYWVFVETQRRFIVVTFLMALLVGSAPCNNLVDPSEIPLPSSRALWEAKSAWAWEREYDAQRSELVVDQPSLQTVSEFAIAKRRGTRTLIGANTRMHEDALVSWHAGVDGLGMVFAAVLAGV